MNYYCKPHDIVEVEGAVMALSLIGGIITDSIPYGYFDVVYFDETDKIIKVAKMDKFSEYLLSHSSEWEEVQPIEVTTHTVKVYQLPDDFDKYQIPDEVKQFAGFLGHDPDKKYEIRHKVYL